MNYLLDENLIKANVVDISWERVNLYIDIKVEFAANATPQVPLSFYVVNTRFSAKAKFKVLDISEDNVYHLYLNITNPGYERCLPRGQYNIHVCYEDNDLAICNADPAIVKIMNNFSRSFFYTAKTKVYNVFFYVDENDGYDLPFKMDILASSAASMGNNDTIPISPPDVANATDLNELKKKKRHKKWALKLRKIYYAYYRFLVNYGRKGKPKMLFMSDQNNYMGSNEEAIYKRMMERGLDSIYDFTFSFREAVTQHYSILSWFKLIKLIAVADTIVLDDQAPIFEWLNAGANSKIIQLWHAGAGFKSSGYSRWGHNGGPAPFGCHRQITYGVAGSEKVAHFFAEIWGINQENVLPTGLPRMDEYQDPEHRRETEKQLYETFPIAKGKKVILFAPTYRGKNKTDAHYPYELLDFDRLYDFCGDEYVVIFKMHPWVSHGAPIKEEQRDKFVDAGPLANINDIFYITDLLITDYSSNIYEFSLMRKPILFFAFDKIPYSFSRGFHRDYDIYTPGKIVENFDEMLEAIANQDFEIEKLYDYIDEQFDYFDSNASDRVIDWAILENMPEEIREAIIERDRENVETALLDFTPPAEEAISEPISIITRVLNLIKRSPTPKPAHVTTAPQIDITKLESDAYREPSATLNIEEPQTPADSQNIEPFKSDDEESTEIINEEPAVNEEEAVQNTEEQDTVIEDISSQEIIDESAASSEPEEITEYEDIYSTDIHPESVIYSEAEETEQIDDAPQAEDISESEELSETIESEEIEEIPADYSETDNTDEYDGYVDLSESPEYEEITDFESYYNNLKEETYEEAPQE